MKKAFVAIASEYVLNQMQFYVAFPKESSWWVSICVLPTELGEILINWIYLHINKSYFCKEDLSVNNFIIWYEMF